jgi:general secretion pathway protein N
LKRFLFALATLSLLLLCSAAGALFFLPASYLTQQLVQVSQGHVLALYSQGSLWNGRARLALRSGGQTEAPRAAVLPGELQWQVGQIHWFPPAIEVKFRGEPLVQEAFSVLIGWNAAQVSSGALYLPAEVLEAVGAPFNTLKPGGDLLLSWTEAKLESRQWQVQAMIDWRAARSVLSRVVPMGSYRVKLAVQQRQGNLELSTLSGPMFLSGNGKWSNGQWQMSGVARPEPAQRDALAPLMTLLGRQLPDGSVQWKAGKI